MWPVCIGLPEMVPKWDFERFPCSNEVRPSTSLVASVARRALHLVASGQPGSNDYTVNFSVNQVHQRPVTRKQTVWCAQAKTTQELSAECRPPSTCKEQIAG